MNSLPCSFSLLGFLPGHVYLKHADVVADSRFVRKNCSPACPACSALPAAATKASLPLPHTALLSQLRFSPACCIARVAALHSRSCIWEAFETSPPPPFSSGWKQQQQQQPIYSCVCGVCAGRCALPSGVGPSPAGRRSALAVAQAAAAAAKQQEFRKLLNKEIAYVLLDLRNEQLLS